MGSACSTSSPAAGGARVHPLHAAAAAAQQPGPGPGQRGARRAGGGGGGPHGGGGASDKGTQVDGRELVPCGWDGAGSGGSGRPARWRKGDPIGAGSFGAVYLGLNTETGEQRSGGCVSVMFMPTPHARRHTRARVLAPVRTRAVIASSSVVGP